MTDLREVEELCARAEKISAAIYIATDKVVADDVSACLRGAAGTLRALVAERDELRGKIDEEHDTDETLLAALITATLCRLPVEIVGDGEWERYREEHGKRWMGDHRAFGGWLSGRITDALESLTAQLAAARAVLVEVAQSGVEYNRAALQPCAGGSAYMGARLRRGQGGRMSTDIVQALDDAASDLSAIGWSPLPHGLQLSRLRALRDAIAEYRTAWAARLNSDTSTVYMEQMHAKANALLALCREVPQ